MLFDRINESFEDEELTAEQMEYIGEAIIGQLDNEELEAFLENTEEVEAALEEHLLTEAAVKRYVVKLDKTRRMNQATKAAVFKIAREKKDPKMKKLIWVWRMERQLEDELYKKYKSQATTRARKTVAKAMSSRSNTVKKVANKVKKEFNGDKIKSKK